MGSVRHTRAPLVIDEGNIVDREFGDEYRDAHFPSGWYVLPLVGAGALVGAMVTFLF